MFRKDVFPWLWVMQDWKAQHMKSILLLRTKCETCDFYENSPNMRGKDMFIPFSHMCKQWWMKAFTSLPEYVAHFTFPLCVSWAYKSSRNLYFYRWALSTAKLIRHCWPPGGAQTQPQPPASEPARIPPKREFQSEQCRGSHLLMLSVLPFDLGMHKIKLHLEKVKRAKPEGRWDNVPWADAGK